MNLVRAPRSAPLLGGFALAAILSILVLAARSIGAGSGAVVEMNRVSPLKIGPRLARERYWFNRRGLQFGVPRGAYRRAAVQMHAMGAARERAALADGLEPGFAWHFIGPEPITNSAPNFGGAFPGSRYDASGRVSAIAADPTTPGRIFVGAANGGVWMSTDDGADFVPIFDAEPTQAIGAIALDPVNTTPPTIYVGTGEGNGADSYYGQGIFKSTDLGSSWAEPAPGTFDEEAFTRIAIDTSKNPPTLFAAVTGGASLGRADPAFLEGQAAGFGLWRSTDGGQSWTQYSAATFGSCFNGTNCPADDVAIDPANRSQIYAAIDTLDVFASSDGGNNFAPACFTNDSPCTFPASASGQIGRQPGRTSLAIGPPASGAPLACSGGTAACGTLYAMAGASDGAEFDDLFRSTDGGASWSAGSAPSFTNSLGVTIDGNDPSFVAQSNYDQALLVSPRDPATVFFGGVGPYESTDSGASWSFLAANGGVHADQHALAIGPDSDTLYLGNDGGAYKFKISGISGGSADFISLNDTLAVGQIQSVAPHPTNDARLIAGFQDNGTEVYTGALPWTEVETGDGGFEVFDGRNPRFVYHTFASVGGSVVLGGLSNNGGSSWLDFVIDFTGFDTVGFYPPLASDPAVSKRALLGGNFVYAVNFTDDTVSLQNARRLPMFGCGGPGCALQDLEFVPSNRRKAWALSTGRGVAQPFRIFTTGQANLNSGANWTEVTENLPLAPAATQATGITPDVRQANTAYLSLSGFTAATGVGHIFRTTDFGASWGEADGLGGSSPLPDVPVLRVLVDRTDSSGATLLAGTDVGVFRSTDIGATWAPFNLGIIPAVPVFDIEQNRNGTIFVGTHGRGAYSSVAPSSMPPSPATLEVSPSALKFGSEVFLGNLPAVSSPQFVTISNLRNKTQNRTIVIRSISTGRDFGAADNRCLAALDPGARCSLPVSLSPTRAGALSGTLSVVSDASNSLMTVSLSGTGVEAALTIRPSALKFPKVRVGAQPLVRTLTLINRNPMPIAIAVSGVATSDSSDFQLFGCSGASLGGAGGRCPVRVTFAPQTAGPKSGTLMIFDNAAGSPQMVPLSGVGE